jgi:hypothetical protein
MLARARSSSLAVNGALTRAVQFARRSTGQRVNKALISGTPCSATTSCPTYQAARTPDHPGKRVPPRRPRLASRATDTRSAKKIAARDIVQGRLTPALTGR